MSRAAHAAAPVHAFVAGLSARHDDAAIRLQRVVAERPAGFAPADLIARIRQAFEDNGGSGDGEALCAYTPAERDAKLAKGWNAIASDDDAEAADSAAEIEAARQAGHDAGFAAGLAAARAELGEAAERDRAMLARLVEALRADARIDRERLARNLRQTVQHLVTRLVGEAGVSAELLAARVTAATELLADAAESAVLRVNPADMALLAGNLPATIAPLGDPQVARGSFVLEAASTIVEDGPELWLEQLARTLDKVALP